MFGAVLVAAAVGVIVGRWSAPDAVVDARLAVKPAECPVCPAAAVPTTDCETDLATAVAMLEAFQPKPREPTPFPEDLPAAFTPEGFRANVQAAVRACELDLAVLDVDCSEYPCFAIFEPTGERTDLKGCSWWGERYPVPGVARANGSIRTDDGDRGYLVHGEWPPDRPIPTESHGLVRFAEIRERLMGEWDGRELTPEEKNARNREFWQRLADEGNEGAKQMLQMLP
jgi:hypothetical protein